MSENIVPEKKTRIYWLDHARGFIMILLVVTMYLPRVVREGPARFFLDHPENSTTTTTMNFFDIGAPAFIVIMGFLMPLSFSRRKEKDGTKNAVKHIVIRYCIILALGLLVLFIDHGSLIKTEEDSFVIVSGIPVIYWDVLPTLGLVGLIALPFLWTEPKLRVILASILLLFYQIMLFIGGWREYAIESIHGGILGTIFGFSTLMIYATSIGEYLIVQKYPSEKKKLQVVAIFGAISLVCGLLLMLIPGFYPNKRQVTLTYVLISLGFSILMAFLFIALDKKVQTPIFVLDSYGKSPFLIYIIAVVSKFIIEDIIGYEIDFIVGIPMMLIITIIALVLDKKEKIVKL